VTVLHPAASHGTSGRENGDHCTNWFFLCSLPIHNRFCAGYAVAMAEMKAFLALLARGYAFDANTNTKWVQQIGRVPVNGLPMRVYRL
jgi:hypothetical protein